MVCLISSNFIFSFLLSFVIDLYSFIPLTASAIMLGIYMRFCNNILVAIKIIPFQLPNVLIIIEIVYPTQNPFAVTIPITIGIPTTVDPVNHIVKAIIELFANDNFKSSVLSTFWLSFKVPYRFC